MTGRGEWGEIVCRGNTQAAAGLHAVMVEGEGTPVPLHGAWESAGVSPEWRGQGVGSGVRRQSSLCVVHCGNTEAVGSRAVMSGGEGGGHAGAPAWRTGERGGVTLWRRQGEGSRVRRLCGLASWRH